jgi:hypothetical protein
VCILSIRSERGMPFLFRYGLLWLTCCSSIDGAHRYALNKFSSRSIKQQGRSFTCCCCCCSSRRRPSVLLSFSPFPSRRCRHHSLCVDEKLPLRGSIAHEIFGDKKDCFAVNCHSSALLVSIC